MIEHGYSPTGYQSQSQSYRENSGNALTFHNNTLRHVSQICTLKHVRKRNTTQICGESVGTMFPDGSRPLNNPPPFRRTKTGVSDRQIVDGRAV